MEVKDPASFYKAVDALDPGRPGIIVISGNDHAVFENAFSRIKDRIRRTEGDLEVSLFTGEKGDESKFFQEIFNMPLFSPFRLFVTQEADEVFRSFSGTKGIERLKTEIQRIPDRTWLLLFFEGTASRNIIESFPKDICIHYQTRDMSPHQVMEYIRHAEKKAGLRLTDDAVMELRDKTEPKSGAIDRALQRLKLFGGEGPVTAERVREILFPVPGVNTYRITDSLFELNHKAFRSEMVRWNPLSDNIFGILKLLLMRTDEIRRAKTGFAHGMNDDEILELLSLKGRHPFIQKQILNRLHHEVRNFSHARLIRIYDLLIRLQISFRSNVPASEQLHFFETGILETFFNEDD